MTFKEVGRMTLKMFNKLYTHYKNDFDLEMKLKNANMTYEQAYNKSIQNDEWF